MTDDELLAVATAAGVTGPVVTDMGRQRPGHGRQRPGWLIRPRSARQIGSRNSILHAVGVVLAALGTGVVGAILALSLTSAPAAALFGIPVGVVAAAVVR